VRFFGESLEEVLVGQLGWTKGRADAVTVRVLGAFRELRGDIVTVDE
jgi:hypothetical protein